MHDSKEQWFIGNMTFWLGFIGLTFWLGVIGNMDLLASRHSVDLLSEILQMNPKPASMFAFSPALLQDRREVLTATSTSGNPNACSRV